MCNHMHIVYTRSMWVIHKFQHMHTVLAVNCKYDHEQQFSNCQRSKSAIFISHNINSNINSLLRLRVGTHYIYIYISDERYIPDVEMKTI